MKLSQSLNDYELSKTVLDAVNDLVMKNIDELVEKYNSQLEKDVNYLDPADIIKLKSVIKSDKLKISMTITSSITPKLLEDWDIYPMSKRQSALTSFEPVADIDCNPVGDEL